MFNDKPMPEMSARAEALREILSELYNAEEDLRSAKRRSSDYTGQYNYEDFFAYEEAKCRELANKLEAVIFNVT